ncbi:hypothetical protein CRG98_033345 [Punica granatum]|uniref:Reverse transcriptase RNase H-like domain-containing protein n=1 Tax=Punica granatum TaxID=22663 RepID=A0A2I0IQH5_PUNGR|nr:hypothetical protein CRG98_033345 [Punica granatum]
MCCALVWVMQRLRQYTLYHTVRLLSKTDPLKYLLSNPSSMKNIAKWRCQLTEYDIEYVSRTSMKGQAITDHLVEFPIVDDTPIDSDFPDERILQMSGEEKITRWKMYFDGAVNSTGSSIGAVLISPEGRHFPVAAKIDFPCTNNIAEYEAYIKHLLQTGQFPAFTDRHDRRTLRRITANFFLSGETLYRRSFDATLLGVLMRMRHNASWKKCTREIADLSAPVTSVTSACHRAPQRPSSSTPVPVTSARHQRHQCPSPAPPALVIQHARARHQRHQRHQRPSSSTLVPVTSATSARHPARSCLSPCPPSPVIMPDTRHRAWPYPCASTLAPEYSFKGSTESPDSQTLPRLFPHIPRLGKTFST